MSEPKTTMSESTTKNTQTAIKHFKEIAKDNGFQNQQIASTPLSVTSQSYSYQENTLKDTWQTLWENLQNKIENAQGWARSQKEIHAPWDTAYTVEEHGYLFEGEWLLDKNSSIHLRQIHHGWVVTTYEESEGSKTLLYQDQYYLSRNKDTKEYLKYRVYYQLGKHSYEPKFSRFMGFTNSNNSQEKTKEEAQ